MARARCRYSRSRIARAALLLLGASAAVAVATAVPSSRRLRWPDLLGLGGASLPPPPRTAEQCRRAARGAPVLGDVGAATLGPLADWLGVAGPAVRLPKGLVDITTVSTIVQVRGAVGGPGREGQRCGGRGDC